MAKKQARIQTEPVEIEDIKNRRAWRHPSFVQRLVPQWNRPDRLRAEQWRNFVRNQPIAITCRDTLINNLLNNEWEIVPADPNEINDRTEALIEYHTELFKNLEGGFDRFVELICQDLLDLPFGGACEVGYWNDDPNQLVAWVEHVDAAYLYPTRDDDFPVAQLPPGMPGQKPIFFPNYALERMIYSPRPELLRKGWGMAPPEKVYLAIEMLYRGDRYYANLLLDTPEAGILDLADMSKESATNWLQSFEALFAGIDGFKVPVLYEHEQPVSWIPLNRPPTDMLYDKATFHYGQIVCAGYGLRTSDIGVDDGAGGGKGTLAGVIREERASRRTGHALLREKTDWLFNRLVPMEEIRFQWIDKDEEAAAAKGKAMLSVGQGLDKLVKGGFISKEEGRQELVQQGLFVVELDPDELPEEPPAPPGPFGGGGGPFPPQNQTPASQGGRGGGAPFQSPGQQRSKGDIPESAEGLAVPPDRPELTARLGEIINPAFAGIEERAERVRLTRLIRAVTRLMVPQVERIFTGIPVEAIQKFWLPEMLLLDFELPSQFEGEVTRQEASEIRALLDRHLSDDPWWQTADDLSKTGITEIFRTAFEVGLGEQARAIIEELYAEGLISNPTVGVTFDLTNKALIQRLERSAAQLVTQIDEGTRFFMRRIIVAGVRQGLARPTIAQAIREGVSAEELLRREDYMQDVLNEVRESIPEMSKARSQSIVNYEVSKAQNLGNFTQLKRSGFTEKGWLHLGPRGETALGNIHPCLEICKPNEDLGFVPIDFEYKTVFEPAQAPPGHPGECHCKVIFNEDELVKLVESGEYRPFTGGK